MAEISLSNSKGRDGVVRTASIAVPLRVRYLDERGRQVAMRRVLKATVEHEAEALEQRFGSRDAVARALVEGDPEIDIERFGMTLRDTARVYVGRSGELLHSVRHLEIVRTPDGAEKERRPKRFAPPNVGPEAPLKWTGKLLPRRDVVHRFVFASKLQIEHINGLTYDFLFGMAQELQEKDSVMLMGAGAKGNEPMIFRQGGVPFRGFLEGRTQGDRYALLLHLSNQELKAPTATGAP